MRRSSKGGGRSELEGRTTESRGDRCTRRDLGGLRTGGPLKGALNESRSKACRSAGRKFARQKLGVVFRALESLDRPLNRRDRSVSVVPRQPDVRPDTCTPDDGTQSAPEFCLVRREIERERSLRRVQARSVQARQFRSRRDSDGSHWDRRARVEEPVEGLRQMRMTTSSCPPPAC